MMGEAKFTPGPWLLDGDTAYALDESGNCNRFSARPQGGFIYRSDPCGSGEHTSEDELTANAHLIAAAPALYEALDYARDLLRIKGVTADKIDNTLALARGETP